MRKTRGRAVVGMLAALALSASLLAGCGRLPEAVAVLMGE